MSDDGSCDGTETLSTELSVVSPSSSLERHDSAMLKNAKFMSMKVEDTCLRLETFQARELNKIYTSLLAIVLIDLIYAVIVTILAKVLYKGDPNIIFTLPRKWEIVALVVTSAFSVITFLVALLFTIRIVRLPPHRRVREQLNVTILAWSIAFTMVPALEFLGVLYSGDRAQQNATHYFAPVIIVSSITDTSCTVLMFYYIWLQADTYYDVHANRNKLFSASFYLQTLIPLIPYAFYRFFLSMATYMVLDRLPLMSLVFLLVRTYNSISLFHYVLISILTFLEALLILLTIYKIRQTILMLKKQNYLATRMKQISSRFFRFHLVFTLSGLYGSEFILIFLPADLGEVLAQQYGIIFLTIIDGFLLSQILIASFGLQQAWCHLPPQSRGLSGWLHDSDNPEDIQLAYDRGLAYRLKERKPSERLRPRTFVLETAVLMFNFAWIAYSFRGEHQKKKRSPEMFGEDRFRFVLNVFDKVTDTQCVMYESDDRIIISFKGTTSLKDVKTDFTFNYESAAKTFPQADIMSHSIDADNWSKCCVHHGFGDAFRAVKDRIYSTIRDLRLAKNRTIFVTGHSLGGALAWLFTMGLKLETDILVPNEAVYTYTYGSPRVGNRAFRELYESLFDSTWQIRVSGDLITKIPKPGYYSVGHKVLLTEEGLLFMDPSLGEMKIAHWNRANMENHKKETYANALKLWCEREENSASHANIWMTNQASTDVEPVDSI